LSGIEALIARHDFAVRADEKKRQAIKPGVFLLQMRYRYARPQQGA
jgi:hypothetical protein